MLDQLRTIDKKRLSDKVGDTSSEVMEEIDQALKIVLTLK